MNAETLKKRIANYTQLSEEDKHVLQAIAIIYAPCSRTRIVDYLRACSIRNERGIFINSQKVSAFLTRLCNDDLIKQLEGTMLFWCMDQEWADYIADDALLVEKHIDFIKHHKMIKIPSSNGYMDSSPIMSRDEICYLYYLGKMRIALYKHNISLFIKEIDLACKQLANTDINYDVENSLLHFIPRFTASWLSTCPIEFTVQLLFLLFQLGKSIPDKIDFWQQTLDKLQHEYPNYYQQLIQNDILYSFLAQQYIFHANFPQAAIMAIGKQDMSSQMILGWLSIINGDYSQAITYYKQALSNGCDVYGQRSAHIKLQHCASFPFLPILFKTNPEQTKKLMIDIIDTNQINMINNTERLTYKILLEYLTNVDIQEQMSIWRACDESLLDRDIEKDYAFLFILFMMYWYAEEQISDALKQHLKKAIKFWHANNIYWLAAEASELSYRLDNTNENMRIYASKARKKYGFVSILDIITPLTIWEKKLLALTSMANDSHLLQQKNILNERRLVWFLNEVDLYDMTAKEQKMTKRGVWSKGRGISNKLLYKPNSALQSILTSQDYKIIANITEESEQHYGYYYGPLDYEFDAEETLLAMIGHPSVFWQQHPDMRIDVVAGDPRLEVIKEDDDKLRISLWPIITEKDEHCVAVRESSNRVLVITISQQHHHIQSILGDDGIIVPQAAKQQVLDAISAIAPLVMVHSDIGGGTQEAETRDADARAHIHLFPHDTGLKLELFVQPFIDGGPLFRPASGGVTVIAEVKGTRIITERDLLQERKNADAVINVCEPLRNDNDADNEWVIDDPQLCLETLEALQTNDLDDKAVVSWPKGQNMHIKHKADISSMKLHIEKERDWFKASGSLILDENNVLTMRKLLELSAASTGRFLQLQDGQFLALTKEFRKRLDEVRSYADAKGDGMRFDGIAALALEDFTNSVGELSSDNKWKKNVKHLKEASKLKVKIPSTLQAELRDYQIEGYCWLAQLAHWGVGACLADDMGLGKTIQGLAVLLHRAKDGPALVMAPTSVCANWIDEITRFTPTLKAMTFGEGERNAMITQADSFDVVICSHGLLHYESDLLASKQWRTIILDEAQAIKNAATKRSQAVMRLQGDFKIITTGTPIENHLGELWNLFRFLNPGLLGSLQRFNREFAIPIERDKNRDKRNQLKKLLQPFMLRRTKQQVLTELPAKTEILLRVDMNEEEAAMYEALRQQTVERLSDASSDKEKGHYQLIILAELMRMRRACCHPVLVMPETKLGSPKLRAFSQLVSELRENRHKALVFSQFVDHLRILRDHLDAQGISYQYLDGSTPVKKRKERVKAFQDGDGDLFLISLKAGGVGLNLTAADYVIHMDPWWNPAAEDQASDRAHRIGQQRPVTVYRMVVRGSIEEQIVDLHTSKRDLASSLLEGSDMSGKMSPSDLLQLIRQ